MKWEYNTVKVEIYHDDKSLEHKLNEILNEQGNEGWELVSTTIIDFNNFKLFFVFKRPKR